MKHFSKYYYLLSLLLPVTVLISLILWGFWYLLPLAHIILFPLLDIVLGKNDQPAWWSTHRFATWLLWVHVCIHIIIFILFFHTLLSSNDIMSWTMFFTIFNVGATGALSAIIVAHELGHRKDTISRATSLVLLWSVSYMHFHIEHNYSHHVHVGTKKDPVTARKHEHLLAFYWRSITSQYIHAWKISHKIKKQYLMILLSLLQIGGYVFVYLFFGGAVLYGWLMMSLIAILYLEYSNYIQHWWMNRKTKYIDTIYSWQSCNVFTRGISLDLSLHADHHKNATKPYHTLTYLYPDRELPSGYFATFWIVLLFPVWKKIMLQKLAK